MWLKYKSHYKMARGHHPVSYNEIHDKVQALDKIQVWQITKDALYGVQSQILVHCINK